MIRTEHWENAAPPAGEITRAKNAVAPAIAAAVFGIFVIYGVGFVHSETIHNAAHDARHVHAFPCH